MSAASAASEINGSFRSIGLDSIAVLPGRVRRSVSPEVVDALAESFQKIGQQQPIVLRPNGGTSFVLIAGRNRLEAARKLKWLGIKAIVVEDVTADEALLAEIDENLIRADLSAAERAAHHAARKEAFERIHGKAKGIGARAAHRVRGRSAATEKSAIASYTADAAKKIGKSSRTVRADVARGENIPDISVVIGTSLDKGDELDALAKLAKDNEGEAKALVDRAAKGEKVSAKTELKKVQRQEREKDLGAKIIAMPERKFGVIYADPPWRFEPYSRETGMDRSADNHYPTSSIDDIRRIPVPAGDDSALFLWATVPMLPDALKVMGAWGLAYKSHIVWGKDRSGTGYWTRNRHELLRIGTRGKIPAPALGTQPDSLLIAPLAEHSVKPDIFHEIIERIFPTVPKLEMFARRKRAGWTLWGSEALNSEQGQHERSRFQ